MTLRIQKRRLIWGSTFVFIAWLAAAGSYFVWMQNKLAEERLAEIEPRHARLLGLQAAQSALNSAQDSVQAIRQQLAYPASQDATQAGNAAQQRIRDIFARAGLQVLSSQVLSPKDDKGFDRISLTMQTEGDALALNSALALLSGLSPTIIVAEMEVQPQLIQSSAPPRLSVQFTLTVMRDRS
jgi:general secretion pathway protein M